MENEKMISERLANNDKCFSRAENIKEQVLIEGKDLYSLIASRIFDEPYDNCVEYDTKGNIYYPAKVKRTIAKKIALNRSSIDELKDFYIKENIENESIVQDLHDKVYEAFPYTFDEDMEEEFIEDKHLDATTFIINMTGYIRYCLQRNYSEGYKKKFLNSISSEFFKNKPENISKFMFFINRYNNDIKQSKKLDFGSKEFVDSFDKYVAILSNIVVENSDQTLEYLDYITESIMKNKSQSVYKLPIFLNMLPTNITIFEGTKLYQYNDNLTPCFNGDREYILKLINDIKNVLNKEKDFLAYEKNVVFDEGNAIEKTIKSLNPSSNIP